MSKIAVVYWSGTGNTEAMADLITNAAKEAGAEAIKYTSAEFSADKIDTFDAIAFLSLIHIFALLEDTGIINSMITSIGLQPLPLIRNDGAVVLGMVYNLSLIHI